MRFKHILYTGACFGLLMAPTIAAEEGFVFTEEDVAAAEEEANKLADNKALMRFNESYAKFRGNIAVNAYKFFERFHNELNQDERETLYNEMTLNAPNGEELGMVAYHAAMSTDGDALYNEYMNEALKAPNLLLAETYQDYIKRTQPRLFRMGEVLWGPEDFSKLKPSISRTWSENQNTVSANMLILS